MSPPPPIPPDRHATPLGDSPEGGAPLRVGFISARPLRDAGHLSGMPHQMSRALTRQGLGVVELIEQPGRPAPGLLARARRRARSEQRRLIPAWATRLADESRPARTRGRLLASTRARSHRILGLLDALREAGETPDVLFGCCISSALYALETDLPIVYFSDATSHVIRATYPALMSRGASRLGALHEIERASLARAARAVFASPLVRESAVRDLGVPRERTRVVPMGANVTGTERATPPADPPGRDDCRLLIIAADPVRKRVDLALRATEILRGRGINASLDVVGPGTRSSRRSPLARSHGRLRLGRPEDRATQLGLLRDCHIQLLPSLGEAFGIAPIESAHFARPSVVCSAGGLSFVVLDGQTGITLAPAEGAGAWADAVESLIDHPERYRAMSRAAQARARAELSWDAWGASMAGIIRAVARDPGTLR